MIGIDLALTNRFERVSQDGARRWRFVFSEAEWAVCMQGAKIAHRFAGSFSTKEAVMKALGGDLVGAYRRIEVLRSPTGFPYVTIDGKVRPDVAVSISHDGGFTIAVAVVQRQI